jgi:two-component system sensor histidine kinase TctE
MSGHARRPGSLRLKLMVWLAVPMALILAISGFLSHGSAMRQATLVTDRQLMASARMIAEQIQFSDGTFSATIPPSALELFASDSHDEIAYAVLGPSNALIAGYPGLNGPSENPPEFGYGFFETVFRTEEMRAIILRQPVITPNGTTTVSVMVGETLKARGQMFQSLWFRGFIEQAALVLAASVSIWIGINREMRPLLSLRRAVLSRPTGGFEPFDASSVQSEIRPLVQALNSYMERLDRQLARQRRFLDNAAHQLRTPLAIMKTQISYATRRRQSRELETVLAEVDGNLSAMARLTNQLLTLGRVEHERDSIEVEVVNLSDVVRDVVAEAAPRALDRKIDLAFDSEGVCQVVATAMLVREMVSNLIDNAIQYAGPGAAATVSVRRTEHVAAMTVEDNGVGVDESDRATLFKRFGRGRNVHAGGSGLGLSIVAEIIEMFGGSVELPTPAGGRGFCVVVHLPLADAA